MSETNIVEMEQKTTDEKSTFMDKLKAMREDYLAIMDEEATIADERQLAPTAGNVIVLATRCIIRSLLGDEEFNRDLSDLEDDEVIRILEEDTKKLVNAAAELDENVGGLDKLFGKVDNDLKDDEPAE